MNRGQAHHCAFVRAPRTLTRPGGGARPPPARLFLIVTVMAGVAPGLALRRSFAFGAAARPLPAPAPPLGEPMSAFTFTLPRRTRGRPAGGAAGDLTATPLLRRRRGKGGVRS